MSQTETPQTPKRTTSTTFVPPTPITASTPTKTQSQHPNSCSKLSLSKTPRKSKQQFVVDLWASIYEKCEKIVNSKDVQFEELNHFLMDKTLIETVGRFWNIITSYCKKESLNEDKKMILKNGKIILSSLMIAKFPNDVLDCADINQLNCSSEECHNSAINVVEIIFKQNPKNFENLNVSKLRCEEVVKIVEKFLDAFHSWQNDDKKKVIDCISNYYEQWTKSFNALSKSSMNEKQKSEILSSISKNIENTKQRILCLCGEQEGILLCQQIENKIQNEDNMILDSNFSNNNNNNNNNNLNFDELKKDHDDNINNNSNNNANNDNKSIEKQLKSHGIPLNIKTGFNLRKDNIESQKNNDEHNEMESKYVENVNGMKLLNLDKIIMEEGSKQYWIQFENQIKQQNWSLLFELLTELLTRIKKISNKKDHVIIDELIDIKFIEQTIKLGYLDSQGFYSIFKGIWQQIKNLHSPSQDKNWDEWHASICQQMQMAEASWHKLLPSIFNMFFLKLDEIEDGIILYKSIIQNYNEANKN